MKTFFSHRPLQSGDFLKQSSPHHSHVVSPVFFLNSATKKIILVGCHHPDGVTRGGPP